jgi:hypothetical protein
VAVLIRSPRRLAAWGIILLLTRLPANLHIAPTTLRSAPLKVPACGTGASLPCKGLILWACGTRMIDWWVLLSAPGAAALRRNGADEAAPSKIASSRRQPFRPPAAGRTTCRRAAEGIEGITFTPEPARKAWRLQIFFSGE